MSPIAPSAWLLPLVVAGGFTHVGGAAGVDVYRRLASPVIDLRAEGDIDAPPSRVRQVLLDYANASRLTSHVAESRVLSAGARELRVYQRLRLPVIADRDVVLHATWGQRGELSWIRFCVDDSGAPAAPKGVVRLATLSGGWDLRPIDGGRATRAVYRLQIDLGGAVPRWMVSGGAAKDLPKLFEGVRRQVARRPR